MAKSFSEDGAAGAFGPGTTGDPGAISMSDPGPQAAAGAGGPTGTSGMNPIGAQELATGQEASFAPVTGGGGYGSTPALSPIGHTDYSTGGVGGGGGSMTPQGAAELATGMSGNIFGGVGGQTWQFEDGGAVPGADDSDGSSAPASDPSDGGGDSQGSPGQNDISQALNSVDQVMQYLYQKHGLSSGDDGGSQSFEDGAAPDTSPAKTSAQPAQPSGDFSPYKDFRQSQDVEDRTGNDTSMPAGYQAAHQPYMDPTTGKDTAVGTGVYKDGTDPGFFQKRNEAIGNQIKSFSDAMNPMSKSLGINDISAQNAQSANQQEQGAIPDTEQQ